MTPGGLLRVKEIKANIQFILQIQQEINAVEELQIYIISLNARKSLQYIFFFQKYQTGLVSAEELIYSFETTGLFFVQTHLKCRNNITKAGADVGKLSSKYILVVNTTLLSHYDRGYKHLKAVNTCPFTARIRQLHCILSGRHIFISRDVPQSVVSLFRRAHKYYKVSKINLLK